MQVSVVHRFLQSVVIEPKMTELNKVADLKMTEGAESAMSHVKHHPTGADVVPTFLTIQEQYYAC